MGKKIRIKVKKPWIAYPGTPVQQNYAESIDHGYLLWDIKKKDEFDVTFRQLPNPQPYVTVKWTGDVDSTVEACKKMPVNSRFRIHSSQHIQQNDVVQLTSKIKSAMSATEVTFKIDQQLSRSTISAGSFTVVKDDLRNTDVLVKLLRDHYSKDSINVDDWNKVGDVLKGYMTSLNGSEEIVRNAKWTLKNIKFDNMFSYGEGNTIDFTNANGIVGIFGPNRAGKSSIVGSIMYSLFNTTDRGSIKNLHVINVRKPYCYSRAIVNVDGVDYAIERQTVKHESKRGQHASTALNVFRMENGEAIDLGGEQRNDTEKVIRKLIGTSDDFLMTSLCAQGETNQYISQGSTRRRQVLSRFLDLDIFDRMYDLAKIDVNQYKTTLKTLPDRDWKLVMLTCSKDMKTCESNIELKNVELNELHERLAVARATLSSHKDFSPVTLAQVDIHRFKTEALLSEVIFLEKSIKSLEETLSVLKDKLLKFDAVLSENSIDTLRQRVEAMRQIESTVLTLRHDHEKDESVLKQQERSLKILDEVPCGDSFPSCKFIKDAHQLKSKFDPQKERVVKSLEKLKKAQSSLEILKSDDMLSKLDKLEKILSASAALRTDVSSKEIDLVKFNMKLETASSLYSVSNSRLIELSKALKNDENAEVVTIKATIENIQRAISETDAAKLELAYERGMLKTNLEKYAAEMNQREDILQQMRVHDLIKGGFDKKSIPREIVSSQLPLINAEISKILQGIFDFTVELEADDESDSMEAYINYGDSRRIVELCSGMEKVITSIAIRVALINISSLPKTNMFIIDEGFGALDDLGVEGCNRLLFSLKRYFSTILIITHVDGVKDAADVVIEITKNEKDSKVTFG